MGRSVPKDIDEEVGGDDGRLRLLLHAADPDGLARARRAAASTLAETPDAEVMIVANGRAIAAIMANPDATTDPLTRLCETSLKAMGATAPAGMTTVPRALLEISRRVWAGWHYVKS